MKRLLSFAFTILLAAGGWAQTNDNYRPFIEEGKVWECVCYIPFDDKPTWFRSYYFEGDTIIEGKNCKKVMERSSSVRDTIVSVKYIAALYEENKRIWKFAPDTSTPSLFYDFSVQAGDSMYIAGIPCYTTMIQELDRRGTFMRCYCFRDNWDDSLEASGELQYGSANFWIEGVGTTLRPLQNSIHNNGITGNWFLQRCSVGDEVIYEASLNPMMILSDIYRDKKPRPFIEDRKLWITATSKGGNYTSIQTFYLDTDTIVADIPCKKLMCRTQYMGGKEDGAYMAALFEQDRRVYGVPAGETQPRLLYDFSIRPGDTLSVQRLDSYLSPEDSFHIVPDFRFSHIYSDEEYRAFDIYPDGTRPDPKIEDPNVGTIHIIGSWGNVATWIEGIGSIASPLQNVRLSTDSLHIDLIECSVDGRIIYEKKDDWEYIQEQVLQGLHFMIDQDDSYRPFIEKGKIWETIVVDNLNSSYVPTALKAIVEYYFDGDTIVGNHLCTKMMWRQRLPEKREWISHLLAPVYEEEHKVYFFPENSTTPLLMYDFDVKAGDTIQVMRPKILRFGENPYDWEDGQRTFTLAVRGFSDEMEGGERQNVLWYEPVPRNYPLHQDFWMKGIGSVSSPINTGEIYLSFSNVSLLIECRVGNEVLYHDSSYDTLLDVFGFNPDNQYQPFIEEGKVWYTVVAPTNEDSSNWIAQYEYFFMGDSIIGKHPCKKMVRREIKDSRPVDTIYVGAFYEQNEQVYFAAPNSSIFKLYYHFGLATGISTSINGNNITILNRRRHRIDGFKGVSAEIQKEKDGSKYLWMEGIGGFSSPINNFPDFKPEAPNEQLLACFYYNNEVMFLDDGYALDSEVKKKWLDFTHVVKPKPKSPQRVSASEKDASEEGAATSDEASEQEMLTGEYSARELFVSLKALTGAYTVTLTDAAGEVVYRKDVQTSNVVALNTLLTDYPDGEYTLTVENAEEQYTALLSLPLVDDAVRDLLYDKSVNSKSVNGKWSDLSGRHLNSQPIRKGIYIKDGRKVLIK
ncbi:MAG: hypothetical protein IJ699_04825 [Bacteroidaceae bacterium]|nr:hypothetical protein [Bacteroidaceae bacterium]